MVVDATLLLDQLGDPRQGPQARFVTESFWASFQSLLDLDQFRRCQSSLSTAPTRCFQAPGPVTLQSSGPPTDRLPMNTTLPRHLGLAPTLLEQRCGFQTPILQSFKVALHSSWVSHGETVHEKCQNVTILGEPQ